jgi:hypothetical protein
MSCKWQDKIALYVYDDLYPAAQKDFAAHLATCPECPAAVEAQMELKKALRIAGRNFSAPPELHAAIYRSLRPRQNVSAWWKLVLSPICVLLL